MPVHITESAIELSPLVATELAPAVGTSDVEEETLFLFDRFRDPLLRYVCAFGMSADDADDLIQDVFLALFRHLRQGRSRSNLQGWLFRVAHNLALKRRARQRTEAARVPVDPRVAHLTRDGGPDPETQLSDRQRRLRLVAVLNALPRGDRQCLYLRAEGLRYREIARVLRMSLGAVAKSVARSIARLQRADEG
jgi:RNA polymerase sigma-70 factor (ECF subfamily)